MGKFNGRLNSLNRKLDRLAIGQAGLACTCGPIQMVHVEAGQAVPKLPGQRCKAHPKQVGAIVVHHSGNSFEEGGVTQESAFPGRDEAEGEAGEENMETFYVG